MAISNPEVIKFVNEVVRPACERLRALRATLRSGDVTYQAGIGAILYADAAGDILDGREAEGVSRLTANDVIGVFNKIEALITLLDADGGANVIAKPCVRALEAS